MEENGEYKINVQKVKDIEDAILKRIKEMREEGQMVANQAANMAFAPYRASIAELQALIDRWFTPQ